jgi:hypothetical protein
MMKLTKYPSNYQTWVTAFIAAASGINASVALNLKKEKPLDLDHYLDGIDKDLLVFALAGGDNFKLRCFRWVHEIIW